MFCIGKVLFYQIVIDNYDVSQFVLIFENCCYDLGLGCTKVIIFMTFVQRPDGETQEKDIRENPDCFT